MSNHATDELAELSTTTAESFLAALSPLGELWRPSPSQWIFRGQGKASWKLIPKAHRDDAQFASFGVKTTIPQDAPAWIHSSALESALLTRLHEALDRAALQIPIRTVSLERDECRTHFPSDTPDDALPLLALAQHLGLPTRLLDWTRHSLKAAYFAAIQALALTS